MPDLTTNLSLKKPLKNENAQISVINENMDIIDTKIKELSDRAEEAFQSANNGKINIAAVVGSPVVKGDTFSQMRLKIQAIKNTMVVNLTAKGITATASETLEALAGKIGNIIKGLGNAKVDDVLKGKTFTNADGVEYTGTLELTGNANAADVLNTKTFYNTDAKTKQTGTMSNNGAINAILDTANTTKAIPAGYTSGGTVSINLESKAVIPNTVNQIITPTTGKVLSQVTVKGESNLTSGNILNGIKIFDVVGTLAPKQMATGTLTPTLRDIGGHYVCDIVVNGLAFRPKTIILYGYYDTSYWTGVYAYTEEIDEIGGAGQRNTAWSGINPNQFTEQRGADENKVTVTITNTGFTVQTLNFYGFRTGCNWLAIG